MSSSLPIRLIAFAAAIVAMGVEVSLAWRGQVADWIALPLAIVSGGSVIWAALALDALVRRGARPDRRDIAAVAELQHANRAVIETHDRRLAQVEELLALAAAEPALAEADHALAETAHAVEQWDALATALPRWLEAQAHWSAIVARFAPDLAPDPNPVADHEVRAARDRLPLTRNFSSQDLKAAATYLIRAERLAVSRQRWADHRRALFDRALAERAAGAHLERPENFPVLPDTSTGS
jgi:hypothetical protein